jgi:hypothetical protein
MGPKILKVEDAMGRNMDQYALRRGYDSLDLLMPESGTPDPHGMSKVVLDRKKQRDEEKKKREEDRSVPMRTDGKQ